MRAPRETGRDRILVLACLREGTGNRETALRIGAGLPTARLFDARHATLEGLRAEGADFALGLHALLSGPYLARLGVPYVLVLGGTDLYEPAHELQQAEMRRAVRGAARIAAFSRGNAARAELLWPGCAEKLVVVQQAVDVSAAAPRSVIRERIGAGERIALLPAGLRRVKDPLHVAQAFSGAFRRGSRLHLVIVGDELEPGFAESVRGRARELPGVHLLPALPRSELLAEIRDADLLLNTSLAEGMCGTILEAMALGTPVIARRNEGNSSLIVDGLTGYLYDEPVEALARAKQVLANPSLARGVAAAAQGQARALHGLDRERAAYNRLMDACRARRVRNLTGARSLRRANQLGTVEAVP